MTPPCEPLRPYPTIRAAKRVYRVGRRSAPLGLRPWHTVTEDAPLSGRFDDSYGEYRMLYTSETPEGALRETLQRFRPCSELQRLLSEIECEPNEDRFAGVGVVPVSWLAERVLAVIETDESHCVNLAHADAIDVLNQEVAETLTLGHLLGEATIITRRVSRRLFNRPEQYAGICMPSKFGANIPNYAFFETGKYTDRLRARLHLLKVEELSPNHGALFEVVNTLGLKFEGVVLEVEDPAEAWIQQFLNHVEHACGPVERISRTASDGQRLYALVCERFHLLLQTAPHERRQPRVTISTGTMVCSTSFDIAGSPIEAANETIAELGSISAHVDQVVETDNGEHILVEMKALKEDDLHDRPSS